MKIICFVMLAYFFIFYALEKVTLEYDIVLYQVVA